MLNFLKCLFGFHKWTTDFIERGNKPDENMVRTIGIMNAFKNDTIMYCKHCKKLSNLNR